MLFGAMAALTGPVVTKPLASNALTISMEPRHQLSLQHITQSNAGGAGDLNKQPLKSLVCDLIFEILAMQPFLPCYSIDVRGTLQDLSLQSRKSLVDELGELGSVVTKRLL